MTSRSVVPSRGSPGCCLLTRPPFDSVARTGSASMGRGAALLSVHVGRDVLVSLVGSANVDLVETFSQAGPSSGFPSLLASPIASSSVRGAYPLSC